MIYIWQQYVKLLINNYFFSSSTKLRNKHYKTFFPPNVHNFDNYEFLKLNIDISSGKNPNLSQKVVSNDWINKK